MSMQRLVLILFLSLTLCNALIGRSNGGLKSVSEVVTNLRSYPVLHLLPDLSPLAQDATVSGVAIGGTLLWLQVWITLTKKGVIESKLSRKIIHSGSAPIFMLLWPLYSTSPSAKYIASSVVAIQAGRLILAGLRSGSDKEGESKSNYGVVATNSLNKDTSSSPSQADGSSGSRSGIVGAISRSGSKKEALQGPLIYTIMLFLGTLLWFRDSPIGVVGITQMAAGDGLADIIGRKFGSTKWPFNRSKSIAGTTGFIGAATLVTYALLVLYNSTGCFSMPLDSSMLFPKVLLISTLCSAVELIPWLEDNISVPVAGAILASVVFS